MCTFYYSNASLLEHSCTPNTFFIIENSRITIKANSSISEDTKLTCSYTNLFTGTFARLEDLKKRNKTCSCSRCEDPTEFDTFFSALKCLGTKEDSCGGTQLPVSPTRDDTQWVCDKCKIELPHKQIIKFVKHLGGEVEKILARHVTIEEVEEFLGKLLMFLHPNHFYIFLIKNVLVGMYSEESLVTKIQICEELIEIGRKFEDCGLRVGKLLHELFVAKVLNSGVECKLELAKCVEEMKKIAELLEEPDFSQTVAEDELKLNTLL